MSQGLIEQAIHKLNCTFEYYFEEYPEIDEATLWWYYDETQNSLCHVNNLCQKEGDLAVHYYRHGYCALYAMMLKELFPEGEICHTDQHMIFAYQGEFYDAGGKLDPENIRLFQKSKEEDINSFLEYGFRKTRANMELKELMVKEARSILDENPIRQRKIEISEE